MTNADDGPPMEPVAITSPLPITSMPQVEFYGIPRERAGVARTVAAGSTLGEVIEDLAARYPRFAADCVELPNRLRPHVVVNVGGKQFLRDPNTAVTTADVILVMSADAGG